MNALLLPGNSSRHSEWIECLKSAMAPLFQHTETQHYRHWKTGEEKADIEYEIGVAQGKVEKLKPCVIIAKSIGTVIASKGTADGALHPTKLILLGVPVNGGVSKDLFSQWLQKIDAQIVIAQNSNDPLGSYSEVRAAFEINNGKISFVELPGETHDYLDFEAIAKLV